MPKRTHIIVIMGVILMLFAAAFGTASSVKANGPWYGNPDPYDCNFYDDCYWTIKVCISGNTTVVGYYKEPATSTKEEKEEEALFYTGTKLSAASCGSHFTGRWVHTYVGKTWSCNLISDAGEDKNAARFSDINYVKATCGEHPIFGPFDGSADYKLCREREDPEGIRYCGNHYDTSK